MYVHSLEFMFYCFPFLWLFRSFFLHLLSHFLLSFDKAKQKRRDCVCEWERDRRANVSRYSKFCAVAKNTKSNKIKKRQDFGLCYGKLYHYDYYYHFPSVYFPGESHLNGNSLLECHESHIYFVHIMRVDFVCTKLICEWKCPTTTITN